ncbi:hypothetical protein C7H19_18335 [Aphanothece hegewaldii CCALA 016]|uniref:Uncharacterized protein n=1 Tax=Aphanothece hegewaldii CCALA 016 TaxID=2107694 RepID=A0A2T1LU58_9CHRO|nr:hypothetical protein [Aphanothece hegewaldii]PSF34963.1 hypothetical protein C7H19_18335 [Aphanothece hegewaldii CCALA 016]
MSNPNPKTDQLKPYQVKALSEPLAAKPLTVRVSVEVDEAIRSLPNKAEWMRRVLTEAASEELLKE